MSLLMDVTGASGHVEDAIGFLDQMKFFKKGIFYYSTTYFCSYVSMRAEFESELHTAVSSHSHISIVILDSD